MLENAESNNLEKAYNLPLASHLNLFDRNFDHIVVNPSQAHLHLCVILMMLLVVRMMVMMVTSLC